MSMDPTRNRDGNNSPGIHGSAGGGSGSGGVGMMQQHISQPMGGTRSKGRRNTVIAIG